MKRFPLLLFILGVCTLSLQSFSQPSAIIADKQFVSGDYGRAVLNYLDDLDVSRDQNRIRRQIAKCYTHLHQPQEAIQFYYSLLEEHHLNAEDQLYLAHNLKKLGEYETAEKWYSTYARSRPDDGIHYMDAMAAAKEIMSKEESFLLEEMNYNTEQDEFGPCVSPNGLFFNRITSKDLPSTCKYDLYMAKGEANYFHSVTQHESRFGKTSDVVFMDISPSGDKLIFTKIIDSYCFNGLTTEKSMAIYEAERTPSGDWDNIRPLPFNRMGYSTGYGSYGASDDEIFFSSNVPGGNGGFDVYTAVRTETGGWNKPINVGPHVNSVGDEISPKWNGDALVFASDFHAGLGGYDLFISDVSGQEYLSPVNLGRPINSTMDDWNLIFVTKEDGYFVTNRNASQSGSDIYYFTTLREKPQAEVLLTSYNDEEAAPKNNMEYSILVPVLSSNKVLATATNTTNPANLEELYSVQVGVVAKEDADFTTFITRLRDIDPIYKVYYEDVIKIRVGSYKNRIEAERILQKVKKRGFVDAFLIKEKMVIPTGEKQTTTGNQNPLEREATKLSTENTPAPSSNGAYMIRLATYSQPKYFEGSDVSSYGQIIKRKKGEYTIFLLGYYDSESKGKDVLARVKLTKFDKAQLVKDENGILRRID